MFSNEFSFPYQDKVSTEVKTAMSFIIGQLKDKIIVPYGIDVISDPMATIELSGVIRGTFIRGQFAGAFSTNGGMTNYNAGDFLRKRYQLRIDDKLKMVHYVVPEGSVDIGGRDPLAIAKSADFGNLPDAFGVSGATAGQTADMDLLKALRESMPDQVLFATTGVNINSIEETYSLADGAFIATHFKKNGIFENPVDENRVAAFMTKLKEYRGQC